MIPLRDDTRRTGTPVINLLLIAANAILFFYELSLGPRLEGFVMAAAFVPARLTAGGLGPADLGPGLESGLLSMFLHGGWAHFLGNMLFLWIFGDNVEGRLGHVRYLIFYLLAGYAATFAHSGSTQARRCRRSAPAAPSPGCSAPTSCSTRRRASRR